MTTQTTQMTTQKTTQIHFVLDRSGSMWDVLMDTIGGFNTFLQGQQTDQNGECFMSLYQFDHEYQIVYQNVPVKEVELLNKETFVPRGQTSLLDAIGRTISCVKVDGQTETKNIVVILTDGHENSSQEFNYKTISKMIEEKEKVGWEFVFLGANQDAIKTAGGLGIKKNSAMTYAQTPQNMRACFNGLSNAISRTRSGETANVSFTPKERTDSHE